MRLPPRHAVLASLMMACGTDVTDGPLLQRVENTALRERLEAAQARYQEQDFDAALAAFQRAYDEAMASDDAFVQAEALTWTALIERRIGSLARARTLAEQSLALKQRAGFADSLFRSLNALGLITWELGQLDTARSYFDRAAAAARRIERGDLEAAALANLGLIQADVGKFAAADSAFRRLRHAGRDYGLARYEANGLTNLGMLAVLRGYPQRAVLYLDTALQIYRRGGDANEQVALAQLYEAYMALGQPSQAFDALNASLTLSRTTGERDEEARSLEALARYYQIAGDLLHARSLYDSALAVYEQLDLPIEAGIVHRAVAELYLTMGNSPFAAQWIAIADSLHGAAGDEFERFHDLLIAAEVQERLGGDYGVLLTDARGIALEFDAPAFFIAHALTDARIADRRGQFQRVLDVLRPLEQDAIPVNAAAAQAEIDALLARAYAHLGQAAQAIARGRAAVHALESVRRGFGSSYFRTSFVGARHRIYADLTRVLLETGRLGEAFEVMDAAKGRALLEHLSAIPPDAVAGDATLAGLAAVDQLQRTAGSLGDQALRSETEYGLLRNVDLERQLSTRASAVRSRLELVLVELMEQNRVGTSLLGQQTLSLAQVQGALQEREAMVSYLVSDAGVLILIATTGDARFILSPITRDDLAVKVRVARDLLARRGTAATVVHPVLEDLYAVLIEGIRPVLNSLGVVRLVIVPHQFLTYLPFAALRSSADGRYLVEAFEISIVPTASALWALRNRQSSDTAEDDVSVAAFAPIDRRLPATVAEVRAIERVFTTARVRRGRRATERAVRSALSERYVVHAATHASLNRLSPLFSHLEFRANARESKGDGLLEVHEILTVPVRSHLVFLSGCETALGTAWTTRYEQGADYATLAQAFLYAGAANVVATLWRIEDEGSARFASLFYEALRAADPVTALAVAQRQAMRSAEIRSPYYWAPYTVSGNGLRLD